MLMATVQTVFVLSRLLRVDYRAHIPLVDVVLDQAT